MLQICQTAETWKVAGCNAEVCIGSCSSVGEEGSWRDVFERWDARKALIADGGLVDDWKAIQLKLAGL